MTTCPPKERLERFLDEQLPGRERDELAAHVTACHSCPGALDRLTAGPDHLRGPLSSARRPAPANSEVAGSFLLRLKQVPDLAAARPQTDGKIEVPVIAGYEVLAELGRGGMGVVYRARQVGLNRTVALKMILAGAHAGPKDLARFRQEPEAVARLHHPNIVHIYDIGEVQGRPYFALELVEGDSLVHRLQGKPQPGE